MTFRSTQWRVRICAAFCGLAILHFGVKRAEAQRVRLVHGRDTTALATIRVAGEPCIRLRQLADAGLATFTPNADGGRIAVHAATATFRRGSPFFWLSRGAVRSLLQLPTAPAESDGILYVSAAGVTRTLARMGVPGITFDPERLLIVLPAPEAVVKRGTPPIAQPDSILSLRAESRANGVLLRIAYRGKPPGLMRLNRRDTATVEVPLGRVLIDTNAARLDAGGAILEHGFTRDASGVTLRITCADPILNFSHQGDNANVTITLRTSRALSVTKEQRAARERWNLDVVVLDAGHGGKDPGAQGLGGTNEKDVTLGIVLNVGRILENAGLKVVYTRKTDVFVELYRRAQIANESKGKLFVSVHCNSMPTKPNPASGFESYILRPGKNETATRVAERENNVIGFEADRARYGRLTEDAFIVASMAQSGFVKHSERFATMVQDELARRSPSAHNNGVSQAGFLVLVGASMPNILIETGYISNTAEERMLASAKGQQRIAEGIAAAVKRFKTSYERSAKR